jgi:hypothetical protein
VTSATGNASEQGRDGHPARLGDLDATRWVLGTLGALTIALGACRVSAEPPSEAELRAAARSVVSPPGVVLRMKKGYCVEGKHVPTCLSVWYRLGDRPLEWRKSRVFANLREHGWSEPEYLGDAGGGPIYRFKRDELKAGLHFWYDRYYEPDEPCRNPEPHPEPGEPNVDRAQPCAEYLTVEWKAR